MNQNTNQINIREFQHHLAHYLNLAQSHPLTITKQGKAAAVVFDPQQYDLKPKSRPAPFTSQSLLNSPVIGMYKNRQDWQGKTAARISLELRQAAWYGKGL